MECAVPSAEPHRWSFCVPPAPGVPVVSKRTGGDAQQATLHRGVDNVQLYKDWMYLRDYCFLASDGIDHPLYAAPKLSLFANQFGFAPPTGTNTLFKLKRV
jgi:hypothetical protein